MDPHYVNYQAAPVFQDSILVTTNNGVICMPLINALPSKLTTKFAMPLEQMVSAHEIHEQPDSSYSSELPQISSDATVDSDEPTHGNGITVLHPQEIGFVKIINKQIVNLPNSFECQNISDSDTNSIIVPQAISQSVEAGKTAIKRRGGWPKGRKRKPELLHLPPKAPATGYNLYLNDMRKQFKDSALAFHEITKIIGNKWSSLSLEEKQPYLERAEQDKRRYRDELHTYRKSGSYQLYMAKKRKKRVQNNILSESDMDATDEVDDEDNEELYCRTCDQWFHNLHNKREHLQGRQHIQAVVGDMRSELITTASSSKEQDGNATTSGGEVPNSSNKSNEEMNISECMTNLITAVTKRENEMKSLRLRVNEAKAVEQALYQQLHKLKDRETLLTNEYGKLHDLAKDIEMKLFELWKVPSLFITTDLSASFLQDSEYLTDE